MDKRNFSNLGEDIKNIVQDAVNTGDFHQLSKNIGNTVNGALDEARKSIKWTQDFSKQMNPNSSSTVGKNKDTVNLNTPYAGYQNNRNTSSYLNDQRTRHNKKPPVIAKTTVPVGKVSGILCTVFGNIGVSILGVATVVLMVVGHLTGQDEFFATIILGILPFLILSVLALGKGSKIRKRIKRMQQYVSLIGGQNYCSIKDLSMSTGLNSRFLVKDLQKMIAIGMFPEGHIDDKKTSFMLNNDSYKLYLDLQESTRVAKLNEQQKLEKQKLEEKRQEAVNNLNDVDKEVRKTIDEGRWYINKVKEANALIPGEEVSLKLKRLEAVTGKIFDYVELHPEQLPEIRKFMEYYLPTTLKLLEAYKEFDRQPVQGDNIKTAKSEIEKTFDTINLAFENLLDNLFEDAAMDISTDISVLETMLAQEGLTGKNLRV